MYKIIHEIDKDINYKSLYNFIPIIVDEKNIDMFPYTKVSLMKRNMLFFDWFNLETIAFYNYFNLRGVYIFDIKNNFFDLVVKIITIKNLKDNNDFQNKLFIK